MNCCVCLWVSLSLLDEQTCLLTSAWSHHWFHSARLGTTMQSLPQEWTRAEEEKKGWTKRNICPSFFFFPFSKRSDSITSDCTPVKPVKEMDREIEGEYIAPALHGNLCMSWIASTGSRKAFFFFLEPDSEWAVPGSPVAEGMAWCVALWQNSEQ